VRANLPAAPSPTFRSRPTAIHTARTVAKKLGLDVYLVQGTSWQCVYKAPRPVEAHKSAAKG
jgi:hypothetical protein